MSSISTPIGQDGFKALDTNHFSQKEREVLCRCTSAQFGEVVNYRRQTVSGSDERVSLIGRFCLRMFFRLYYESERLDLDLWGMHREVKDLLLEASVSNCFARFFLDELGRSSEKSTENSESTRALDSRTFRLGFHDYNALISMQILFRRFSEHQERILCLRFLSKFYPEKECDKNEWINGTNFYAFVYFLNDFGRIRAERKYCLLETLNEMTTSTVKTMFGSNSLKNLFITCQNSHYREIPEYIKNCRESHEKRDDIYWFWKSRCKQSLNDLGTVYEDVMRDLPPNMLKIFHALMDEFAFSLQIHLARGVFQIFKDFVSEDEKKTLERVESIRTNPPRFERFLPSVFSPTLYQILKNGDLSRYRWGIKEPIYKLVKQNEDLDFSTLSQKLLETFHCQKTEKKNEQEVFLEKFCAIIQSLSSLLNS